jgi:Arc/MetJ-type ribon-helix-helix transcriptional regulator
MIVSAEIPDDVVRRVDVLVTSKRLLSLRPSSPEKRAAVNPTRFAADSRSSFIREAVLYFLESLNGTNRTKAVSP